MGVAVSTGETFVDPHASIDILAAMPRLLDEIALCIANSRRQIETSCVLLKAASADQQRWDALRSRQGIG
jgi:hypothetical protein